MQLLIRRIEDENRIYLRPEELHRTPFLQRLFQPVNAVPETFTYLLRLLKNLHDHITTDVTPSSTQPIHPEDHPTSTIQYPIDSEDHLTPNIQHPTSNHPEGPQPPTPNIQHPAAPEDHPDSDLVLPVLEKELIYHLYIHVNRLKALSEENQFSV